MGVGRKAMSLGSVAIACLLGGCNSMEALPHTRLGAIPFPGPFTLYVSSGVDDLGEHYYSSWSARPFAVQEGARGIMYTCRAGFLDLAHVRLTADWARYAWEQSHALISVGGGSHTFDFEDAHYTLEINLPTWWQRASETERKALINEASLIIGQRVACEIQTWHEIATWYGWTTVPLVSEEGSAFTWDDAGSHFVGALIASRVLKDGTADYDKRMTEAMRAVFEELGAVSTDLVDDAAEATNGHWWKSGVAIRRDLETGLDGKPKQPWLVPNFGPCAGATPAVLRLPTLKSVKGRNLESLYELRIKPSSMVRSRIKAAAGLDEPIVPSRDYPKIIAAIRAQMHERWGDGFDSPKITPVAPPAAAQGAKTASRAK